VLHVGHHNTAGRRRPFKSGGGNIPKSDLQSCDARTDDTKKTPTRGVNGIFGDDKGKGRIKGDKVTSKKGNRERNGREVEAGEGVVGGGEADVGAKRGGTLRDTKSSPDPCIVKEGSGKEVSMEPVQTTFMKERVGRREGRQSAEGGLECKGQWQSPLRKGKKKDIRKRCGHRRGGVVVQEDVMKNTNLGKTPDGHAFEQGSPTRGGPGHFSVFRKKSKQKHGGDIREAGGGVKYLASPGGFTKKGKPNSTGTIGSGKQTRRGGDPE